METMQETKAIMPTSEIKVVKNKKKFFFPDHQVTVEAETQEEAERALAKPEEKE